MRHVHTHPLGRPRAQRGMVTFELAVGILAAAVLAGILAWTVSLVVVSARCVDSATAIARQLARGDTRAAGRAKDAAPRGSTVRIHRQEDRVVVVVSTRERFGLVGPVSLTGQATAFWEPGVAR